MKQAKAIVLAAGQGKRMGSVVPKQFLELDGSRCCFIHWNVLSSLS